MKMGEAMYKSDPGAAAAGEAGPGGDAGAKKDDVVDADFEEVDKDKK
jgi:molecular chaperone DnaK